MSDIAASDFRTSRRYVRLDTVLRLRWLAVLGQLVTIFIVTQGLDFKVKAYNQGGSVMVVTDVMRPM